MLLSYRKLQKRPLRDFERRGYLDYLSRDGSRTHALVLSMFKLSEDLGSVTQKTTGEVGGLVATMRNCAIGTFPLFLRSVLIVPGWIPRLRQRSFGLGLGDHGVRFGKFRPPCELAVLRVKLPGPNGSQWTERSVVEDPEV